MTIYPAIDLLDGGCVRLKQGRFDEKTAYEKDPVSLAKDYARRGAEKLHLVDLEGSRSGGGAQRELVARVIREGGLKAQVGGGIRSAARAREVLESGAEAVIIGSLAVKEPEVMRGLLAELGGSRVVMAVDVRLGEDGDPRVAVEGWQKDADLSAFKLIDLYLAAGLERVLVTDIARDGTGTGPNVDLYRKLSERYPRLEIQASGGIGSLDDIRALRKASLRSAIIGKALLEGRFTLEEALAC